MDVRAEMVALYEGNKTLLAITDNPGHAVALLSNMTDLLTSISAHDAATALHETFEEEESAPAPAPIYTYVLPKI